MKLSYLKLINKEIESMDDESLVVYASKSILREKIKEQELLKYFKFNMNNELVITKFTETNIIYGFK